MSAAATPCPGVGVSLRVCCPPPPRSPFSSLPRPARALPPAVSLRPPSGLALPVSPLPGGGGGVVPREAWCQQQVSGPRVSVPSVFTLERVTDAHVSSLWTKVDSSPPGAPFFGRWQFFPVPSFSCSVSARVSHGVSLGFPSLYFLRVFPRFLGPGCCEVVGMVLSGLPSVLRGQALKPERPHHAHVLPSCSGGPRSGVTLTRVEPGVSRAVASGGSGTGVVAGGVGFCFLPVPVCRGCRCSRPAVGPAPLGPAAAARSWPFSPVSASPPSLSHGRS